MGYWIKEIISWALLASIAYLLVVHVRPVYVDAFKARKAASTVAEKSAGKSRDDVAREFSSSLHDAGVSSIKPADYTVARDGAGWIVGADYGVDRKIGDKLRLSFEFSVSSDRKNLWSSI